VLAVAVILSFHSHLVTPVCGLLLVLLAALTVSSLVRPGGRRAWIFGAFGMTLLGGSQLLLLAGGGSSEGVLLVLDHQPVLTLLTLGGYPLLYIMQTSLLRQRVKDMPSSSWFDGVHCSVVLAAVACAFFLRPVRAATGLQPLALVALLGRPTLDLLLFFVALAVCSILGWRSERAVVLLAPAFGLLLTGDVVRVLWVCGVLASPGWGVALNVSVLGAVALLVAAALARGPISTGHVALAWSSILSPLVMLAASGALLGLDHHHHLPTPTTQLALVGLAGVGVKVALVFREVLALAGSRDLALTDELTGLPNRRALTFALTRATSDGDPFSLLLFDLDRFKDVNDSYGHAHGDDLLREVAQRAARALPGEALLTRLGGDEFAVLLPGSGLEDADRFAADVLVGLAPPLRLHSVAMTIRASIGVASWPFSARAAPDGSAAEHVDTSGEVLRRADAAMYTAKRAGGGTARYDDRADRQARAGRVLTEELRSGLEAGQLQPYYQPQVDARTGVTTGFEALVRWHHPHDGLLAPAVFLDLAEENGLMAEITTTVLHQAASTAASWHARGWPLRISVNLSTSCLLNPDLPLLVRDVVSSTHLDPALLVLEITETTLMQDPERSRDTIEELLLLGVSVSIDDYGTGYSSLAYLQDLPAAELKLDRTFTQRLGHDPRVASIIKSTTDLAHSLGLRMLVEGVEDAATLAHLVELGVDETQGYHHARPMPAAEVPAWLAACFPHRAPQLAPPREAHPRAVTEPLDLVLAAGRRDGSAASGEPMINGSSRSTS